MTEDPGTDTRIVDVAGRSIVVRQLKDAQLILLARDAKKLEDDAVPAKEKLEMLGWIMDTFESAIVQEDDRAYVLQKTRAGELDVPDYLTFLSAFRDEPNRATKRAAVRRGRPRKSAV